MNVDSAILIPVHNRRALTLGCLRRLAHDQVFAWAKVFVIDDGSTDGTGEAIRAEFPPVHVVRGNGDLWWTGAIAAGMQRAIEDGKMYVLWLNDDSAPAPGALRRLRELAEQRRAIVSGTCVLPGTHEVVYGGLRRRGFGFDLVPFHAGAIEPCDTLSGNLVCFPAALVRDIGLPDATRLPHAGGDIDYGLRARAAGWPVLVAHDALADATPNYWRNHASWLLSEFPVREIWRSAWDKRSYGYFPAQWTFFSRHWGWRGSLHAVWLLAKRLPIMLVRLIVPQSLLRRLWSKRSAAWREEQRMRRALHGGFTSPSGRDSSRG